MEQKLETGSNAGRLKVIGAGFGRTGTLSLKTALEELGVGPCYHMAEVINHTDHAPVWVAAWQGEPVDWHTLLHGYQAAVDWPACSFYKELMEAYPTAKVILSVRDPEQWYESVLHTVYAVSQHFESSSPPEELAQFTRFSTTPSQLGEPDMQAVASLGKIIWEKVFNGRFEDREYAISVFLQHVENVKQHVPAEKLLVYNVKEGWEPLCAFLGIEPPADKAFPHVNDRASFPIRRG